jgi:hypothetical protein
LIERFTVRAREGIEQRRSAASHLTLPYVVLIPQSIG